MYLISFQEHVLWHDRQPITKEKTLQCTYCSEIYQSQELLDVHIEQAHAHDKRNKCPICYTFLATPDELYQHIKTHDAVTGEVILDKDQSDARTGSAISTALDSSLVGKPFCPYCPKQIFQTVEAVEAHIRSAHGGKIGQMYLCQHCEALYPSVYTLNEHIKQEHKQVVSDFSYPCGYCDMEFASLEGLAYHKENVHKFVGMMGKSEHVYCSQCNMGFNSSSALTEHVHNVHTEGATGLNLSKKACSPGISIKSEHPSPRLDTSNSVASRFSDLASPNSQFATMYHSASRQESWTCDHCNSTFLDLKSFQAHLKLHVGSEISKFTCSECSAQFTNEEQLENHIFIHFLALTTEYGCTSCLKLFSKPDELQKHLMDIHAHHLYRCSLCKEIFDSKVNIQVHFAIKHSNECKLFKCTTCGSIFRSEMEWQLHVKVSHLGIQNPYRCLFCKESFSTEVELQHHVTTHKKAYPCPLCDEAFHVEYLLDKHMQTKHCPEARENAEAPRAHSTPVKVKIEKERDVEVIDCSISSSSKKPSPKETGMPRNQPELASPRNHSNQAISLATPPAHPAAKVDMTWQCELCKVKFPDDVALQKHYMREHGLGIDFSALVPPQSLTPQNLSMQKSPQIVTSPQVSPKAPQQSVVVTDKFSQLCVYCNQTFKTKGELEKHMKTHASPSNQKCNICDDIFPSATILAEHKLTHCKVGHGNMCVICKVTMKNEDQFYNHSQQHGFQGANMQCIICRQTLASMLELQMHGKHHFQSTSSFYTCCVCLKSFESKENLVSKLNTSGRSYYVCKPCYHGEPQAPEYRCNECNLKFETSVQLEQHILTHKRTYQCIKCQQSFATEYDIHVHVATHMMQEGNMHDCKICGNVFDSPAKLQCHLIEHTFDSEEFQCYVCSALFTHSSGIQMHVLEHGIGARRYSCSQCHQKFFFSAELQHHLATHGIQASGSEFQCPECLKIFTNILHLNNHRKVHRKKENSMKCSLCPEVFSNMSDLQQHFFSSHSDLEVEKSKKSNYSCPECHKEFPCLSNLQGHMKVHNSGKS